MPPTWSKISAVCDAAGINRVAADLGQPVDPIGRCKPLGAAVSSDGRAAGQRNRVLEGQSAILQRRDNHPSHSVTLHLRDSRLGLAFLSQATKHNSGW